MMNLFSLWNKWGFEILIILSIVTIISLSIYRYFQNGRGTWSKKIYFKNDDTYQPPPVHLDGNKKYSRGEIECRRVLEKIFRKPFNSSRPNFLRNPVTGNKHNLEIDCFNPQLRLGVEYNGAQHYKYIPYFHKNKEAFRNQMYRDDMKRRMCKDNGVNLIEVPYTVKIQDIETFLVHKLQKLNYI